MYCNVCGNQVEEGASFCRHCGAAWDGSAYRPLAPAGAPAEQPEARPAKKRKLTPADAPDGLERREFVRRYALKRQNCTVAAILGYVCAGISLAMPLLLPDWPVRFNVFLLAEMAFVVLLCLFIHIRQSRVCAILWLVYSLCNCALTLMMTDKPGGWWLILSGILALMGAFGCQKEWKSYEAAQAAKAAEPMR
ncbi:MAG: zinc ribbon domain-containing protein [Clostridia bacterium]|nr:zinc ribbon domain-containing protein [Clostridia bacterium]